MDARDVIIRPVITEQSVYDMDAKKYTFIVDPRANKTQVKYAIEELFDVDVKKVITTLSEAETAMLRPNVPVRIQMCVGFGKTRLNSNVIKASVEDVLKEGMMIEV